MKKYFIDYSEDAILPRGGDAELVAEYAKKMTDKDMFVDVFNTKLALMTECAQIANQAKDGCDEYIEYSKIELRDMIDNIE